MKKWAREAAHRYDVPKVPTWTLVEAIGEILDVDPGGPDLPIVLDLLDIVCECIPAPTIQDVKVALFLISHDYEADDISYITGFCIAGANSLEECKKLLPEHRKALAKVLREAP